MHCFLARVLSDAELSGWLRQHFPEERFAFNRYPEPGEAWVESRFQAEGDFPWSVDVYLFSKDLEEEMARVAALAADFGCAALTSDGRRNPYTWVLVTPEGERLWVDLDGDALDEREAFILQGSTKQYTEGGISSARALDPTALTHTLSSLLEVDASRIHTQEWIEPATMPSSPFADWHPIVEGVHYCFNYGVSLDWDRRPWRSLVDEAVRWERIVARLAASWGQPFCAHSGYYHQIRNIPGGSDSEVKCIWVDGVSRREIITKQCRASW